VYVFTVIPARSMNCCCRLIAAMPVVAHMSTRRIERPTIEVVTVDFPVPAMPVRNALAPDSTSSTARSC